MKEPEKLGEKYVTEWDKKTAAQKAWPAPHLHFEARKKKKESYEALGGKENECTTANVASDITAGIQEAVEEAIVKSNRETTLAVAEVKTLTKKVDKLTEALVLLALSTAAS